METARWSTIPELVRDAGERFGDEIALTEGDRRWTYEQLVDEVRLTARAMMASGLERGERVAIWAPNIAEWVIVALATYEIGAVLVPVNTRFKGAEAAYVLRRSKARMLFTVTGFLDADYVGMVRGETDVADQAELVILRGPHVEGTTDFAAFIERGVATDDAARAERASGVDPRDVCHVLFTSGTTGDPKGVMLAHGQVCRAYSIYCRETGIHAGDRYLIVLPFFHSFGLHAGILCCLMVGATIVPELVFDVSTVVQRIATEKVTVFPGPPTVFQSLLDHPASLDGSLASLRLSVVSAATVPVELIRAMREKLGIDEIVTGYGLTEASGIVSMCRHDDEPEVVARTAGRPLPGVELRTVGDDGRDQPEGVPGEIWVRGENVMVGYLDDPERTAEVLDPDRWLHTGDVGMIRSDGNVVITDRKKDMYIAGGFNVSPAEVEKLILTHPDVTQVAVVAVPDHRLGEVGYAFVVPRAGASIDPARLHVWCREKMANYKVPRYINSVDALPLNATGKVLKFVLQAQARSAIAEAAGAS